MAKRFEEKMQEADQHATVIRQVLAKNTMDTILDTNADLVAKEEQGSTVISQEEPRNEG